MTMPSIRKKTSRVSSLRDALKVWMRIFRPGEWRVSLNSLRMRMIDMNSRMSMLSMWWASSCRRWNPVHQQFPSLTTALNSWPSKLHVHAQKPHGLLDSKCNQLPIIYPSRTNRFFCIDDHSSGTVSKLSIIISLKKKVYVKRKGFPRSRAIRFPIEILRVYSWFQIETAKCRPIIWKELIDNCSCWFLFFFLQLRGAENGPVFREEFLARPHLKSRSK